MPGASQPPAKPDEKPDEKPESLTTTVDTVPKETETIRPNLKPNAEPVGEAAKTDPGQRPEPEAKVQETPAQPAAAVEGAEKPDDSLATRSKLNPPLRKPLLIVDDPLKKDEKRSTAKELFEPVIINVPRRDGGQRAGEPTAEGRKQDAETATPGATRRRLVEGKEVISDQQCTIDVSKNVISLLSNGGSVGVLVSVTGAGQAADISAGSSSLRDIEVRSEPEIAGLAGRRFYVIKAISDKAGIYQVNFESPCGKKEITVHVR